MVYHWKVVCSAGALWKFQVSDQISACKSHKKKCHGTTHKICIRKKKKDKLLFVLCNFMSWQYFLKYRYHKKKKFLRKCVFCKEMCWGGCCFSKGIITSLLEHTAVKLRRKLSHSWPYSISYVGASQIFISCRTHARTLLGVNVSAVAMGTLWFLLLTWWWVKRKPGKKTHVPSSCPCDGFTLLVPFLPTHLSIWDRALLHSVLSA